MDGWMDKWNNATNQTIIHNTDGVIKNIKSKSKKVQVH